MKGRTKSSSKNIPQWVTTFEDKEKGLTDKFPFKAIKSHHKLSINCSAKIVEGGTEIIVDGSEVDRLYIIAKGSVGVGDLRKWKSKSYWIERAALTPYSVLGEIEVPMKVIIQNKTYNLPKNKASQNAWASSETLKWLACYTYEERIRWGEEAVLLEIPSDQVNTLLNIVDLREHILFDLLKKSKAYYLPILESTGEHKWDEIALSYRRLYEQRINVGCHINEEIFIFGAERYNTLKPGKDNLTKSHKGFKSKTSIENKTADTNIVLLKYVIEAAKKNEKLKIKITSKKDNLIILNKLEPKIKKIFLTQDSKEKIPKRDHNNYICIDERRGDGYNIMSLKLL